MATEAAELLQATREIQTDLKLTELATSAVNEDASGESEDESESEEEDEGEENEETDEEEDKTPRTQKNAKNRLKRNPGDHRPGGEMRDARPGSGHGGPNFLNIRTAIQPLVRTLI